MSSNNQHGNGPVGAVYAAALFQVAEESGQLQEITEEIEQLEELLAIHPDLLLLLSSPQISSRERAGSIDRIFKGRVSDTLHNFLHVVNRKDRMGSLPAIIKAFNKLIDEKHAVVEVDAYVASRLDDEQAKRVAQGIGEALKREVVLHQYIDPELIGGLKIRVGDRLFDGTVQTQLKLMREKLTAAGREKARVAATE